LSDTQRARGGLHQYWEFSVPEVSGNRVERLLGVVYEEELEGEHLRWPSNPERRRTRLPDPLRPSVFLLKVQGQHWQRFFFDAGLCFWGEWELEDIEEDLESPLIDYGTEYALVGRILESAECVPRDVPPGLALALRFDTGARFIVYYTVGPQLEWEALRVILDEK
jgi:hypothetical protein